MLPFNCLLILVIFSVIITVTFFILACIFITFVIFIICFCMLIIGYLFYSTGNLVFIFIIIEYGPSWSQLKYRININHDWLVVDSFHSFKSINNAIINRQFITFSRWSEINHSLHFFDLVVLLVPVCTWEYDPKLIVSLS